MATKLTITISGATSLGSYGAGVTYEIFDPAAQGNTWADQTVQVTRPLLPINVGRCGL